MYFEYGDKELNHLKSKDKKLAWAIEKIGPVKRETDADLFASVIRHIIGQQISTAAQQTIWQRMTATYPQLDAETIVNCDNEQIQKFGMTFKKAEYIKDLAGKVLAGDFDLHALREKSDAAVIAELTQLKGIGVWTAEILMIFCLQRPDIISFGDLAIHRGLRMLHRHRKIDGKLFAKYKKRYSPYGSVASLYLWAIAGGAIPDLTDPALPKRTDKQ